MIGVILTFYMLIDGYPSGVSTKLGLWLGLISVIGVAYGEYTAMNEELAHERY